VATHLNDIIFEEAPSIANTNLSLKNKIKKKKRKSVGIARPKKAA